MPDLHGASGTARRAINMGSTRMDTRDCFPQSRLARYLLAAAEKTCRLETWLERCLLRLSGVNYRLAAKSNGNSGLDNAFAFGEPGRVSR